MIHTLEEGELMSEPEESGGTVVELMLLEPEIVAWLEDYRPEATGSRRTTTRRPAA